MNESEVYRYPRYYDIGYRWNTAAECDFIEACVKTHGPANLPALSAVPPGQAGAPGAAQAGATRILDIGCGVGRHMITLATRGYDVTGIDLRPEMIAYVQKQAKHANVRVTASVDDLRRLTVQGTFDLAYCFMDTFRFLLTNEEITVHLRTVASLLKPGGLYLIDFWVPRQWDMIGNEIHQWEQTDGGTTVRVFYLQHPESVDPIEQTFEDELVFEVDEAGERKEIRGGPTRTRLLLPQEFRALVEGVGLFDLLTTHGEFDLGKPLDRDSLSWRMISVLKRR